MMTDKILCVDDEQNILDGFQRQLRKSVDLATRTSGAEGLKAIEEGGPYAVVISDMKMPGMDGISFLAKVREMSPDSVRIMLTGNADLQTAMNAVNEGNIFRFLTKPCTPEVLLKTVEAGIVQYQLITAEKELLEKTVKGSIQVLTDMLAFANPSAFSRTTRIQHYVTQLARALGLEKIWQLEIAAMLSQLGCIAIPQEVMRRWESGSSPLKPEESTMLNSHPKIAHDLITTIPRLQFVAKMVAHQNDVFKTAQADPKMDGAVLMGASILKVAVDLDTLMMKADTLAMAVGALERKGRQAGEYNPTVLAALPGIVAIEQTMGQRPVRVAELEDGMVLAREVRTLSGQLLLSKGQRVTSLIRIHLQNQLAGGGIKDDIHVCIKLPAAAVR